MADSAAGVCHIAQVTGNHMDVDMRNGLAGSTARVETDIIAVRFRGKLEVEQPLGFLHQRHQRGLLRICRVEPSFDNAAGGHQNVSGRDWKTIKDRKSQVIRAKPLACRNGKEG